MSEPFAYDAVDYPTAAAPQMHPGHFFAEARLFGLDPAPVDSCRYLEVGCGDGMHLIGCALELPRATFVGLDLSAAAIERGNAMIAKLGLTNVSLYAADLTKWQPPAEGFDYAAAHGLYSWVPAFVRDSLLSLIAKCIGNTGVGYVSYNTYPGCYVRRMVWEMLRFHTDAIAEPAKKIQQAREMLKFIHAAQPSEGKPLVAAYKGEVDGLLHDHHPSVLYHDDLSEVNEPVYFREFMEHAKRFGLRFVAEAEPCSMESRAFPPQVAGVLRGLAERDVLLKEQYLDFLRLRRFRQTLLAADGKLPQLLPDAARVKELAVSGNPKAEPEPADLTQGIVVHYTGPHGSEARLDIDIVKSAFAILGERFPGRLPLPNLLREAAKRLGREASATDAERLSDVLAKVWMTGMVELNGYDPKYAETVSERPIASPLARLQIEFGEYVTTLLHASMRFEDAPSRVLLQLLDGTHNREQLAAKVLVTFPPDNRPDPAALREGLERNLQRLAKAGLLIG